MQDIHQRGVRFIPAPITQGSRSHLHFSDGDTGARQADASHANVWQGQEQHIPRPGTAHIPSHSQTSKATRSCLCRRSRVAPKHGGDATRLGTPAPSPLSLPSKRRQARTAASPFFQVTLPLEIPSLGAMKLSLFVFLVFQTLYFIPPPAAEKDEQKAGAGSKKSIRCRKIEDLFLFFISDTGYPGNTAANKAVGYCPPAEGESSGSPPQPRHRGTLTAREGAGSLENAFPTCN